MSRPRIPRLRRWALALFLAVSLGAALSVAATAPIHEGLEHSVPVDRLLQDPGLALRAAVAALDRGEPQLADALLRAVAERHPVIADHAELLRMRLRVESGDLDGAIALEASWQSREGPLRARFYTLLGEAHLARGDEAAGRAALEYAVLVTRDRARLARLELAIAESYLREGARQRAAERMLELWTRYADLPEANTAQARLEQLEGELGRRLRTASRTRQRADRLFDSYHNEAALAAYDRALALGLSGAERTRASDQRAETLFRLRRYPEAIAAYDALPASEERAIQRARAEARAGRVPEGARALEELGTTRRGDDAVRAQYLAALLWDGEGEHDRARRLFEDVIRRSPGSELGTSSRWFLGWEAFRAGQDDAAIRHFEQLARDEKDPVAALRPRYWMIRARERQGDPNAPALYAELGREYPFTYYGWLALRRAGELVPAPVAAPGVWSGRRALSDDDLARPKILLEAGLVDQAREELAALYGRAAGLEDRLALAELYADAGDFASAQRLMVDAYSERLARGPSPQQVDLWWYAWPAPYPNELREATRSGRPSAELVYSIMREESGYRPEVISVAGARGLLQLMPETAKRVARAIDRSAPEPADLLRPDVNIELGSAYLGQLLARFGENAAAAIGSYNAGPEAVSRWLVAGEDADDVWVEQIPYTETRAYVKRVLRSLHVYRVLY